MYSDCLIGHASCHRQICAWILSADQKQQHVNVCEELRQTKQQSSRWKSPNSPRSKKARQVKSKVNSMLIIFFDIKGIVHKEFVLAGHMVNSAYYCVLWHFMATA
jgi:hypothetical protein